MKKFMFVTVLSLVLIATQSMAGSVALAGSIGNYGDWGNQGWIQIVDDNAVDGRITTPGAGGQDFDAEYLFVKKLGTVLSIGLQTGFDLSDGKLPYGSKTYYAGDLALSFDGDVDNSYEYAFDFGLYTEGYTVGHKIDATGGTGFDPSGLYSVSTWDNDIYYNGDPDGQSNSSPFAMDEGAMVASVADGYATNVWGSFDTAEGTSYYRQVSFDLANIENFSELDVHWTMSCGNDAIDGSAPVPEPATLILLGSGLAGLAFYRRKKK